MILSLVNTVESVKELKYLPTPGPTQNYFIRTSEWNPNKLIFVKSSLS